MTLKNVLPFVFLFLAACNTDTTDEGYEVKDVRVMDIASDLAGCYTAVANQDTSELVLQHVNGEQTLFGDLEIYNFEKDAQRGSINGEIKGDLIVAWYEFHAEDTKSVRQVVFKVEGDKILEGYGDTVMQNDTVVFKSIQALNYLDSKPFIKRPCK